MGWGLKEFGWGWVGDGMGLMMRLDGVSVWVGTGLVFAIGMRLVLELGWS